MEEIGRGNCWLPIKKRWTKPAKKRSPILVEENMIPGWVFVKEEAEIDWRLIDGVHGVLKYGAMGTLWIEGKDLQDLVDYCHEEPELLKPSGEAKKPRWKPKVGEEVRVMGLFGGAPGRVIAIRGSFEFEVDLGNISVLANLSLLRSPKSGLALS